MNPHKDLIVPIACTAALFFGGCCGFWPSPTAYQTPENITLTPTRTKLFKASPTRTRTPTNTPSYCSDSDPQPGLFRHAAKMGFTIGAYVTLDRIRSDGRYCGIMLHDYNLVHMEEFSHPDFWGESPGQYHFELTDPMVDYAGAHGWRIRASHLVWGWKAFLPEWLKNGNFSKEEYEEILERHIRTIMGRYRDRIQEWSIANEVVDRDPSLGWEVPDSQLDFWAEKIGPEYVQKAFQWAREADPDAILILNGNYLSQAWAWEEAGKAVDKTAEIVRSVNRGHRGLIDGVGMQMHTGSAKAPTVAELTDLMSIFTALGVRIYITEMDVDLHGRDGTQEEKYAFQAKVYRNVLTACIRSGKCASFDTMNIEDSESVIEMTCPQWGDNVCPGHTDGDPLLYDGALRPKPAYYSVLDVLENGGSYGTNLALNRPVMASSTEDINQYPARYAVDGNETTRWGSAFTSEAWIAVDLGERCWIQRIVLDWENAYGKAYEIRISSDGTDWETVYSTTSSFGGYDTFLVSGTGRYVMMLGLVRTTIDGVSYGYSLWEYEVYGAPERTLARRSDTGPSRAPPAGLSAVLI